jgi:hypothetical protein
MQTTRDAVRDGVIDSVGVDYVIWRSGKTRVRVKFKDGAEFRKEDYALFFSGHEGKQAVISVDGPFYISLDIMPGEFEGSIRVVPNYVAVESITTLDE